MLAYIVTLQTVAVAKSYYACKDIKGALLENEGGSGTSRYSMYGEFSFCICVYNY